MAQRTEDSLLPEVVVTAEEEVKQSLGVSVITAEDLAKNPPAADLAEVLRREPGVNLTGSATSGMRGNRRQIDLRGMGPDNTLVLIDGRPARSRNASRQGWTGERDTDGDTAWIPPEAIERVEVLRGPAAARYGSGAMGGVINIITKRPDNALSGSVTYYGSFQQDSDEGDTYRATFNLSGPMADGLGFRLFGGHARTQPDALNINAEHSHVLNGVASASGKTGNRNKFINGLLTWDLDRRQHLELSAGFNRKSDLYSGDTQNLVAGESVTSPSFAPIHDLYGSETTVVYRSDLGLTHRGDWSWGTSRVGLSYGNTRNVRATEGLFGGPEGAFLSESGMKGQAPRYTAELKEARLDGEINLPLQWLGKRQLVTLGGEVSYESLDDAGSTRSLVHPGNGMSLDPQTPLNGDDGKTKQSYTSFAIYVEDNIALSDAWMLTPTLRFNQHEEFGFNVSPGVSASYAIDSAWTLKGAVARAYKTPSLYQANPNYLLFSLGGGCPTGTPCYLQGNADLDNETSINSEIGIAYDAGGRLRGSLAYFHNDYRNKIVAGVTPVGATTFSGRPADIQQWVNMPKAVVAGLEGNLFLALTDSLDWNTNLTYMIESKDRTYHQPLSVIPEYTINSTLDWQPTHALSLRLQATVYGKQQPATYDARILQPIADDGGALGSYALFGLSGGYRVSDAIQLRVGVNNLFDKKIYRTGLTSGMHNSVNVAEVRGAGARTYNEHGRSFFVSLTGQF